MVAGIQELESFLRCRPWRGPSGRLDQVPGLRAIVFPRDRISHSTNMAASLNTNEKKKYSSLKKSKGCRQSKGTGARDKPTWKSHNCVREKQHYTQWRTTNHECKSGTAIDMPASQ